MTDPGAILEHGTPARVAVSPELAGVDNGALGNDSLSGQEQQMVAQPQNKITDRALLC